MKTSTYYRGIRGIKWGIWNKQKKSFVEGICEDTPMLAEARLFQKIGDDARKWRYEFRQLHGDKGQRATEKQLEYIQEMREFSDYPIPEFTGTTKKEASDYIDRWKKTAHESTTKYAFY